MSPTIMSGVKPASMIALAPPSTPTSDRLHVADVGAQRAQVPAGGRTPRTTTSDGRSRKSVSKRGSSILPDSSSRSSSMCSTVFCAKRSQRLADLAPARVGRARTASGSWTCRAPRPRRRRRTSPPPTSSGSPSRSSVEQRVVGQVDEVDAGLHQQQRAHVRVAARRRRPAVEHGDDARGDQVLRRDAVQVVVVDDGDLARDQPLDEQLRLAARARGPGPRGIGARAGPRLPAIAAGGVAGAGRCSALRAASSGGSQQLLGVPPGGDVVRVGAEHPHELGDDLPPARAGRPSCAPARRAVSLPIAKWRAASEAICGRWVMQMTWRPVASARSCSPTARAVWPPMPASTSSNTSVAPPLPAAGRVAHQRQHHARQLAAGGDLAHRRRRARRGWARSGTPPPSAPAGPGSRASRRDLERRAVHRQLGEPLAHRRRQRGAAAARAARSSRRPSRARRARASPARRSPLQRDLGAGQLVAARAAALRVREHRRDRPAVLALQPLEHRQALLDRVELAGLGVEAFAVAAQLAGEVLGLSASARQRSASASSSAVDARDAVQARGGRRQQRAGAAARSSAATASAPPSAAPRSASRWRRRSRSREQLGAPRPRRRRPPRSRRARTRAGRARARARPPARAARPATPPAPRARAWPPRTPPAAPAARARRSRRGSPAGPTASVSLRCSCWP